MAVEKPTKVHKSSEIMGHFNDHIRWNIEQIFMVPNRIDDMVQFYHMEEAMFRGEKNDESPAIGRHIIPLSMNPIEFLSTKMDTYPTVKAKYLDVENSFQLIFGDYITKMFRKDHIDYGKIKVISGNLNPIGECRNCMLLVR